MCDRPARPPHGIGGAATLNEKVEEINQILLRNPTIINVTPAENNLENISQLAYSISNEKKGYTLSDRSTWIAFNKRDNLKIVCEDFPPLFNQYGIILVNSQLNNNLNYKDAKKYIDWFKTDEVKELINNFKSKGEQLFYYNYN